MKKISKLLASLAVVGVVGFGVAACVGNSPAKVSTTAAAVNQTDYPAFVVKDHGLYMNVDNPKVQPSYTKVCDVENAIPVSQVKLILKNPQEYSLAEFVHLKALKLLGETASVMDGSKNVAEKPLNGLFFIVGSEGRYGQPAAAFMQLTGAEPSIPLENVKDLVLTSNCKE